MGTHCSNPTGVLQYPDPRCFEWRGVNTDRRGEGHANGQAGEEQLCDFDHKLMELHSLLLEQYYFTEHVIIYSQSVNCLS